MYMRKSNETASKVLLKKVGQLIHYKMSKIMFQENNKLGGRKKGSVNKATKEIREMFVKLVNDNLGQLDNDIKQMEPKQRFDAIIQLAKYILPTLKAVEVDLNDKPRSVVSMPVKQFFGLDDNDN